MFKTISLALSNNKEVSRYIHVGTQMSVPSLISCFMNHCASLTGADRSRIFPVQVTPWDSHTIYTAISGAWRLLAVGLNHCPQFILKTTAAPVSLRGYIIRPQMSLTWENMMENVNLVKLPSFSILQLPSHCHQQNQASFPKLAYRNLSQ